MGSKEKTIRVLDKGFVRLVEFMGGDQGVVSAARVCVGSGSKGSTKDRKLISYLLTHHHMTPFEHAVFKFHVSAPIFVMRQWIRHRAASYNEISARYAEVQDAFYHPSAWRSQASSNRQSSTTSARLDQRRCTRILDSAYAESYAAYRRLLGLGAAREMARLVMPVGIYTEFYWTINARNLMHFINLRADSPAQWEIQRYAEAISGVFAKKMPWTWEAFIKGGWKGSNPKLDAQKKRLGA